MSELQQKAIHMIDEMSDDNISFLIEIINRLRLRKDENDNQKHNDMILTRKLQALKSLDAERNEISKILPNDFDPDKELEEARAQRFESID
jgi:hypothetical protein